MKGIVTSYYIMLIAIIVISCNTSIRFNKERTAEQILGDPTYHAISYGGYRQTTRDIQPTVDQLMEDMLILHAMGIKIIRTYNVHLPHASNVLQAIRQLKIKNEDFEMYVMLGAWIDCKNAWTQLSPIHDEESERNSVEIERAIELAKQYPDIVKIIAVGNESMVKWATAYYVEPEIILKWVNYLQTKKEQGELAKSLWITSSDNFASWGGGGEEYRTPTLIKLIESVDFISMHTYPMHDTYYNPSFWNGDSSSFTDISSIMELKLSMEKALMYAKSQYDSVQNFILKHGIKKPIHIGETGWASSDNHFYGSEKSKACDELKAGVYYRLIRQWTDSAKIACFYFEAFDEQWKDSRNPGGSENHFGLFTLAGQAKYAIWPLVDAGIFEGYQRDGNTITKTFNGDSLSLANTYMRLSTHSSVKITN